MKQICLYHGSDLDGQCSGAIYAEAHKDVEHILYPIDYGDSVPWELCTDADVTLIDFSIQPWEDFERLMRVARQVVWIDHHRSAIKEWEAHDHPSTVVGLAIDETQAGCELAWKYFFPEKPLPEAVWLLGRYDVWDHIDSKTLPFQYGMRMLDMDPLTGEDREHWQQDIFTSNLTFRLTTICNGELLLKYQQQNDAAVVSKTWFPVEFAGHKWQACNRLGKGSKFFESVRNPKEYSGIMSFGFDGKQWTVGLYTDIDGMDCGAIAKHHGGGGHPGAAGFQSKTLPFSIFGEFNQ